MAQPLLVDEKNLDTIERAKWEQFPVAEIGRLQPGNPYVFRQFPKMMVRARRRPGDGKISCFMEQPAFYGFKDDNEWGRACEFARVWTAENQKTVGNEEERKRAMESGEGWRDTVEEAVAHATQLEKAVSDAAAERNYRDRNMSEKAKAEALGAERAQEFGHLAEIEQKPIKRRGRPRKAQAEA